ncbi:predicted protein [Histoplasma mississippiense (nom. inval.)]|nr:predicted protein [Histoplasma mississippiense (nom. inval.)]EDN06163.1 predicted protein [Histoplasma mississippiense (nom. inval.)]
MQSGSSDAFPDTSQLCNYGRGEACISGVLWLGLKQETLYYSSVKKYDSYSRACWVNYYICPPLLDSVYDYDKKPAV